MQALTLSALLERGYDPLDFRFLLLSAHYRGPQQFRFDLLDSAKSALDRLRRRYLDFSKQGDSLANELTSEACELLLEFETAMFNDLNLPEALAVVWKTVDSQIDSAQKVTLLDRFDFVLGLELDQFSLSHDIPDSIQAILSERETARRNNDWEKSDELRKKILSLGFNIKDTSDGQVVEKK